MDYGKQVLSISIVITLFPAFGYVNDALHSTHIDRHTSNGKQNI